MLSKLGSIFRNPEKRAVISWLGGGAFVVAGGIWTTFTFYVGHKDGQDKKGGNTAIPQSGQGAASGRDTTFQGPVFSASPRHSAKGIPFNSLRVVDETGVPAHRRGVDRDRLFETKTGKVMRPAGFRPRAR